MEAVDTTEDGKVRKGTSDLSARAEVIGINMDDIIKVIANFLMKDLFFILFSSFVWSWNSQL